RIAARRITARRCVARPLLAHELVEVRTGAAPVALDGGDRVADGLGDLLVLHPPEEPELDDLGEARAYGGEAVEGGVEGEEIEGLGLGGAGGGHGEGGV